MRVSTLAIIVGVSLTPVAAHGFQQISAKASAERQAKGERLICRYTDETGSAARRRRQCFTRTEWDRIAEAARIRTQRMQSDNAGQISGN